MNTLCMKQWLNCVILYNTFEFTPPPYMGTLLSLVGLIYNIYACTHHSLALFLDGSACSRPEQRILGLHQLVTNIPFNSSLYK